MKWVKATERCPEVGKRVICRLNCGYVSAGNYRADGVFKVDSFGTLFQPKYVEWTNIE